MDKRAERLRSRLGLVRRLYRQKLLAAVDSANPEEIIRCSYVLGYIDAVIKLDHLPINDILPLFQKQDEPSTH